MSSIEMVTILDSLSSVIAKYSSRILNTVDNVENQCSERNKYRKDIIIEKTKDVIKSLSTIEKKVIQEIKNDSISYISDLNHLDREISIKRAAIR